MPFAKDHPVTAGVLLSISAVALSAAILFGLHHLGYTGNFRDSLTVWTMLTVALFLLTNVGFYLFNAFHKTAKLDAALVFSILWAIAAVLAIISTIFFLFPEANGGIRQAHAFLALAAGCVLGWALGMYISPKSSSERSEFARIGAAVAGLASGYTIKGVQTWIFLQENHHYQIYFFIAGIAALLTAATIYNVRAYSLDAVRITFDHPDANSPGRVAVTLADTVTCKAAVTGPDDTSVYWQIIGDPVLLDASGKPADPGVGTITPNGIFTPALPTGTDSAKCHIKAISIGDPSLSNMIDVSITRA